MADHRPPWMPQTSPSAVFVQHVLVVIGIVAGVYLLWLARDAVLVVVAAIIVAVLLVAAAAPFKRWIGLPHRWAVLLATACIVGLVALTVTLIGSEVRDQVAEAVRRLPVALDDLRNLVGLAGTGTSPNEQPQPAADMMPDGLLPAIGGLLSRIGAFTVTIAGAVTGLVLVAVMGIYLALDPELYKKGLVKLFPSRQQARADETLGDCGVALYQWMMGQLLSMLLVGVLVGLGAWAIGLPAPLALGLIAFLTEFVPIIGPIAGSIPGLLLALSVDFTTFLWAAALYLVVQQIESNVLSPIIQRRMVALPPALLLVATFAFGLLFGIIGVLIAAPLTVIAFVAVKKLYVRETLGGETTVPGEHEESPL